MLNATAMTGLLSLECEQVDLVLGHHGRYDVATAIVQLVLSRLCRLIRLFLLHI